MTERLDIMPGVVQEYTVYYPPKNGRIVAFPTNPSQPDIEIPNEPTPPAGWLKDEEGIRKDEKLQVLANADYIAVTLPVQPKSNRGVVKAVESGVNAYYERFGREEVVFLWNANKDKGGVHEQPSNPALKPSTSSRFNGRLETSDGTILPILRACIGRDTNECSEDPKRIINKTYLDEPDLSKRQIKLLDMSRNYLEIISEMKNNGIFPEEWGLSRKIAEWEKQQAQTKEVAQQISEKDPLEHHTLRTEQAERVKEQKYPGPKVSSVAELLKHYPEYRQEMPIPVSVAVYISQEAEI